MYRRAGALAVCCLAGWVGAATHSAWATPIPWDQVLAVSTLSARPAQPAFLTATPLWAAGAADVRFELPLARGSDRRVIEVFSVDGCLVGSVSVGRATTATWHAGAARPAGAYVARLVCDGVASTVGFALPRQGR